jgi:hypothetical protein
LWTLHLGFMLKFVFAKISSNVLKFPSPALHNLNFVKSLSYSSWFSYFSFLLEVVKRCEFLVQHFIPKWKKEGGKYLSKMKQCEKETWLGVNFLTEKSWGNVTNIVHHQKRITFDVPNTCECTRFRSLNIWEVSYFESASWCYFPQGHIHHRL